MNKPREIKYRVRLGSDGVYKVDETFLDDCVFKPGEEFIMREVSEEFDEMFKEALYLIKVMRPIGTQASESVSPDTVRRQEEWLKKYGDLESI